MTTTNALLAFNPRPRPKLEGIELKRALQGAISTLREHHNPDGSFYVFGLDDEMRELFRLIHPIYEVRHRYGEDPKEEFVGHDIPDLPCRNWLAFWQSGPRAAEYLRYVAALAFGTLRPVPPGFREFARHILMGSLPEPRRDVRPPTDHRNYLMAGIAIWVTERWQTPFSRDKIKAGKIGSASLCAASVAGAALYGMGIEIEPATAANICNSCKKGAARARASHRMFIRGNHAGGLLNALREPVSSPDLDEQVAGAMTYFTASLPD